MLPKGGCYMVAPETLWELSARLDVSDTLCISFYCRPSATNVDELKVHHLSLSNHIVCLP